MVAWGWIVAALFGGAFLGIVVISLCIVSGRTDRQYEQDAGWQEYPH